MIYPLPAVLVSCGATPDEYNLFTAAWTGTICSDPAMCYVSIRQERHSHDIIERNMAFTINLTNEQLAHATDWCGVKSGRDFNKCHVVLASSGVPYDQFLAADALAAKIVSR